MPKRAIYTCITKNYDEIPEILQSDKFDCVYLLDAETHDKNLSKIKLIPNAIVKLIDFDCSAVDQNRYAKMHPHIILPEYDQSIYIDGNINVRSDPFELFNTLIVDPIALYAQPDRDCAYNEIDELVRVGISSSKTASLLKTSFKSLGLPPNFGLFEANVIYRSHNDPRCILLMQLWWQLWINSDLKRDQPYLGFLNFLSQGELISTFGYSNIRDGKNPYFFYSGRITKKHKGRRFLRRMMSELKLYKRGT